MSSITVSGLVATTPRHLVTQDGLPITSFRLASSDVRVNAAGVSVEESSWYTVTSYHRLALNVAGSVSKGDRVVVSGSLKIRDWDNGERTGTSVEIECDVIGHDLNRGTTVFTRNVETVNTAAVAHECNCNNCGKQG